MSKAYRDYSTRKTSQSEKIPGKAQVKNSAGGYVFEIDDWSRLDRFLILGSEGGTYYVNQKQYTIDNAEAVRRCIKEDGIRVVNEIVEVSDSGRAPKNDPALFALAMCSAFGNTEVKQYAFKRLPEVARIGTHLFHFVQFATQFRGWGRGLKNAVANWYNNMTINSLAYQVVKYQSRDGWSNKDLLRLSHAKPVSGTYNNVYKWITGTPLEMEDFDQLPAIIVAYERAKGCEKPDTKLIATYGLTREMLPTSWLNSKDVWATLLNNMPMTAMIRNLGKMSAIELLKPMSQDSQLVVKRLTDNDYIRKSRIHPLSILVALKTYSSGQGLRGSLTWEPVPEIVDALDDAFYMSFGNIESTNKRILLGVDVSGSMSWESIAGMPITPAEASAAMALVTAKTEDTYFIRGFANEFRDLGVTHKQRLDDVMRVTSDLSFGSTDCALPMMWALEKQVEVDTFIIYTDNETWAGNIHPCQALNEYRQKTGINAKLIVVGMTATNFSIADPNDSGMLDVVGFDTATPNIINDFSR